MPAPKAPAKKIIDPTTLPPAESEAQLTPEQQEIARLRHELAVQLGKKAGSEAEPEPTFVPPVEGDPENILIHFVADGWMAGGVSWKRGQETEVTIGSRAFNATVRNGRSWLLMDDAVQMERYGQVFFRRGPWPGKSLDSLQPTDFPALKVLGDDAAVRITREDIKFAAQREEQRKRAFPAPAAM